MDSPIISFKDFSFQYTAQAKPTLINIDLDIYPGEKVLIAGASGSGKSTLSNCINGLIPFAYAGTNTGSLFVNGIETKKSNIFELSHSVGTVLQDTDGQFIGLTVAEDIAFALENDCIEQGEMKETVNRVAKLVDIDPFLTHAPHELSGGQKQRVSLAGVMIEDVKILLFDEPLANLDPSAGRNTIELIEEIQEKTGATILIIEHRLEDTLWKHVDRIVLMEDGKIVANMRPDEILAKNLLLEHGIREPLYLSALRYAGISVQEDMHPEHIDLLRLTDQQTQTIQKWYQRERQKLTTPEFQEKLLEVQDISFGYQEDKSTLEHINFTVHKGEMLSIVGKNGAGKSTMAKVICGFEQPDSGKIVLNGRDLCDDTIKERAQYIGYVMQNPNQMISKPMIWDEVEMALMNTQMTQEERKERVEEALKICGLYAFRKWPVSALSYGQKKRVTIASILVQKPQIIILDEPTAGQDYRHYTEIMEFLKELNQKGFTIIMITHDMHLMLEYTTRAIVFSEGKILADQRASQVLTDPQLVDAANLKETSLYTLCLKCGIDNPQEFTECFISYEEGERKHG